MQIHVKVLNKSGKKVGNLPSLAIYTHGIVTAIFVDTVFFAMVVFTTKWMLSLGLSTTGAIIAGIFGGLMVMLQIALILGRRSIYMEKYEPEVLREEINNWLKKLDEDIADLESSS